MTNKGKNRVELINLEFYAYHGCFSEEKIIGNHFRVSFSAETDVETPGKSDRLEDALNYQELYNMIKSQMEITSNLLESVAFRILNRAGELFPSITEAEVSISKLNPPLGGKAECSRIVMSRKYN
jgi:dihydroneopterin aldolase